MKVEEKKSCRMYSQIKVCKKKKVISIYERIKIFFSIFLIGSDKLALTLAGANFRFIQVLLLIFTIPLLINKKILDKKEFIVFMAMITLTSISIYFSLSYVKSIMYIFWLTFNYLIVFTLFKYLAGIYNQQVYSYLFIAYRLQIIIGFFLYLTNLQKRVSLFYYEPSYFSLSILIFISISVIRFYADKNYKYWFDFLLILIGIMITQSMTLIIGLFFIILFTVFLKIKLNFLNFLKGLFFLFIFIFSIIFSINHIITSNNSLLMHSLISIVNSSDISNIINFLIHRGGNRVPRIECAWDIWNKNLIFGVGIGAYKAYLSTVDTSVYLFGYKWDEPISGRPAINIYLEILATTGIVGFIGFIGFISFLLRKVHFQKLDYIGQGYFVAFFTLMFTLNFESNYLRLYLWMTLGLLAGSTYTFKGSDENCS